MLFFEGIAAMIENIKDMFSEVGFSGTIEHYADKLFELYTTLFVNFMDKAQGLFYNMGNKAITVFHVDFMDNFFVTVCGFIFGFFILKFVLGKVFDLVGRWLDPL